MTEPNINFGLIALGALIVILMNYLADLLCQIVDPRTRMR